MMRPSNAMNNLNESLYTILPNLLKLLYYLLVVLLVTKPMSNPQEHLN